MGTPVRRALWPLLAALTLLAACGRPSHPPNVIVLVLDTMRADRLAAWGAKRTVAPFVDSLAARGTAFRHAYAQTSWTSGSVASIITSRYLLQHGVTGFNKKLADDESTLAEVLQLAGYRTCGLSANALVTRSLGFAQGYDHYQAFPLAKNEKPKYLWFPARADTVNAKALEWIDQQPKGVPLFLYLQYMEPHTPYDPPAEALARLRGNRETPSADDVNAAAWVGDLFPPSPEMMEAIQDYYDASIMAMDAQIAALFEQLGKRGLLENALIVVTADHGEEFREHGIMGHGKSLYDTVVRVPLVIVPPGSTTPIARDEVVQLVDVAPTILDWSGIERPPSYEGHSLRPWTVSGWRAWFAGKPPPARAALSELERLIRSDVATKHHRALLDPERRKIIRPFDDSPLWFDQRADPGETDPDALTPAERETLSGGLDALIATLQPRAGSAQTMELDAETRERLKALGYAH
ncbi:MAG: sulfatase [bacterium]|nr:sulfatase [bacterium]